MTTSIHHADFVDSIAAALQYISYYHPADYIAHLARAYELEQGPAAKDAIAQILTNSRMCAEGHRPICQDTGIVNVFLKIGMDVRFEGFPTGTAVEDAVNEGVRRGYLDPENKLRASIVADPHFERKNTKDNTPAVVHMELVEGNTVDVAVAAKGGGSENKTKFVMLHGGWPFTREITALLTKPNLWLDFSSQSLALTPATLADMARWTKERLKDIEKPRDSRPGWSMVSTPAIYLAVMAGVVPKQEALSRFADFVRSAPSPASGRGERKHHAAFCP
jgi:hypothetical protein